MLKEDAQCGNAIANQLPTSNKKPKRIHLSNEDDNIWTLSYNGKNISAGMTVDKMAKVLRKLKLVDKEGTYLDNVSKLLDDCEGNGCDFMIENEDKLPNDYKELISMY